MGFITEIPGTVCSPPPEKHPRALGLGVIGLHEGRTMLLAAASRCRYVYPVAGCDLSEAKLAASRAEMPDLLYTSEYQQMLRDPRVQVVAIYTPDALHAEHITAAFEAGKDVICTKPVVDSLEGARDILSAGRRTGRRLMVGQSTRFFEPFLRQRAAFERGEIGNVELADAHYIHRMDWYYRKSEWVRESADWVFLGLSHPIDLLRFYLGRIVSVHATGSRSAMAREFGVRGFDIYCANVVSEAGVQGRAMGHYGCHELPRARNCIELMLYGDAGSSLAQYHDMRYIHTGASGATERSGLDPSGMQEIVEDYLYAGRQYYFNSEVHGMHYGEFANYADHFGRAIIEGTPNSPDLLEAVETFCVMEAVRRSAQSREVIDVRPLLAQVGIEA